MTLSWGITPVQLVTTPLVRINWFKCSCLVVTAASMPIYFLLLILWYSMCLVLTRSLPCQFFPECHPRVWFSFTEVPAGYVLWCRCTAELHVLNDEYTRQWHLTHFNWWDNSSVAVNMLTAYVVFIGLMAVHYQVWCKNWGFSSPHHMSVVSTMWQVYLYKRDYRTYFSVMIGAGVINFHTAMTANWSVVSK